MAASSLQLLTFMVVMFGVAWGYTYQGSCSPECTNMPNGAHVWDPKSCTRFYMCMNEVASAVPLECPDGEVFNQLVDGCEVGTSCNVNFPHCVPSCKFDCQGGSLLSANRKTCSKFNFCNPSGHVEVTACDPSDPYFDGDKCQADVNECCDPCLVYCDEANSFVANPYDCTKFYFCNKDEYFPGDADLFSCDFGQYFDPINGVCSADASCPQLC